MSELRLPLPPGWSARLLDGDDEGLALVTPPPGFAWPRGSGATLCRRGASYVLFGCRRRSQVDEVLRHALPCRGVPYPHPADAPLTLF